MIEYLIYSQSYTFWMIVLAMVLFVFWIFLGGETQEFVGLTPLQSNQRIAPYVRSEPQVFARTAEDLWSSVAAEDVCEEESALDTTPLLPEGFESRIAPIVKPIQWESRGERQCRLVMELLHGHAFPKVRPQFLRNPETGRLLELDCFCEPLSLAVEYNGIQHYVWPNYTNQSHEKFIKQQRRDQLKVDLCDLNGIYLISVPYNVPIEQIEDYIIFFLPENVQQRLLEDIEAANDCY